MDTNDFLQIVLTWYDHFGRHDLPWQKQQTPYRVWISEIMLQQTQVATVIPYFQRFMSQFPNIKTLANANVDEVLAQWSGLGYYARARNLHHCAQTIQKDYGGQFPNDLEQLCRLKGIGRSTAGAVLSLGMKIRGVILDGNVKRVLARYHGIDSPINLSTTINKLWQLADHYTPNTRHWHYNQAMMDLGAMICTRSKPKCGNCPLNKHCKAYSTDQQSLLPIKQKTSSKRPIRSVFFLMIHNRQGELLLQQRPPMGIWGGLWSFPQCDISQDITLWCLNNLGLSIKVNAEYEEITHQFSHFILKIKPVYLELIKTHQQVMDNQQQIWYKDRSSLDGGVPAPIMRLLTKWLGSNYGTTSTLSKTRQDSRRA